MNAVVLSVLVTACVFGGGVAGLHLHRLLPERHLTKETQEVIKLSTGMLSVLASLVLGLLIATAKGSYDTTDRALRSYAAELAMLNETLRDYGAAASVPHDLLRCYTERFLRDGWPGDGEPAAFEDDESRRLLEQVRGSIRALKPIDDGQKSLQAAATDSNVNLLRQRWLLIEQQGSSVQGVVLVILVSWVTMIFASFGLNAPRNSTVLASFLIASLAIGGAVFLILEMDRPVSGIMRVSDWPVRNALAQMNW
jgi:hypothetical protein